MLERGAALDTVGSSSLHLVGICLTGPRRHHVRQRRLAGADKLLVSGSHRFIADYLIEEVLHSQPEATRQFLLATDLIWTF